MTSVEWDELRQIICILQPFNDRTMLLESHRGNGALWEVLSAMDELLDHLEKTKQLHAAESAYFAASNNPAWDKLNKYYELADFNPVFHAAVVLHPGFKFEYFEGVWSDHPTWISAARDKVSKLWKQYLESQTPTKSTVNDQSHSLQTSMYRAVHHGPVGRSNTVLDSCSNLKMSSRNIVVHQFLVTWMIL